MDRRKTGTPAPGGGLLPPRALDSRGYIVDQSLTDPVPFGKKGSAACGCGWIAAYNLRRWRGDPVTPEAVARRMRRIAPLSGRFGVNVLSLWLYLLCTGMRPLVLVVGRKTRRTGAGIVMYKVKKGAHYAAFLPGEGDRCLLLNGVYGARGHECRLAEFLSEHSAWPLALVFAVHPAGAAEE